MTGDFSRGLAAALRRGEEGAAALGRKGAAALGRIGIAMDRLGSRHIDRIRGLLGGVSAANAADRLGALSARMARLAMKAELALKPVPRPVPVYVVKFDMLRGRGVATRPGRAAEGTWDVLRLRGLDVAARPGRAAEGARDVLVPPRGGKDLLGSIADAGKSIADLKDAYDMLKSRKGGAPGGRGILDSILKAVKAIDSLKGAYGSLTDEKGAPKSPGGGGMRGCPRIGHPVPVYVVNHAMLSGPVRGGEGSSGLKDVKDTLEIIKDTLEIIKDAMELGRAFRKLAAGTVLTTRGTAGLLGMVRALAALGPGAIAAATLAAIPFAAWHVSKKAQANQFNPLRDLPGTSTLIPPKGPLPHYVVGPNELRYDESKLKHADPLKYRGMGLSLEDKLKYASMGLPLEPPVVNVQNDIRVDKTGNVEMKTTISDKPLNRGNLFR